MSIRGREYQAMVSSDWNECLAPTGPFDPVSFHHPDLTSELSGVFKKYTANLVPFREAIRRIQALIPSPVTEDQMDAYLDECFKTYRGVPELIEWCLSKDILFMINTTGSQGYFQRVFSRNLLPQIPALSANPMIRYPKGESDPPLMYDLFEIEDKARHTEAVMRAFGIPPEKVVLIGDSGGDGPHFEWGAEAGAYLIGCMTKWSLKRYCEGKSIQVSFHFGLSYSEGEANDPEKEMQVNFMELKRVIEAVMDT
jgi:phosphoserine phosphatase